MRKQLLLMVCGLGCAFSVAAADKNQDSWPESLQVVSHVTAISGLKGRFIIAPDVGQHADLCKDADSHKQYDAVCRTGTGSEYCQSDQYHRRCAYYTRSYDYDNDGIIDEVETICNTCLGGDGGSGGECLYSCGGDGGGGGGCTYQAGWCPPECGFCSGGY